MNQMKSSINVNGYELTGAGIEAAFADHEQALKDVIAVFESDIPRVMDICKTHVSMDRALKCFREELVRTTNRDPVMLNDITFCKIAYLYSLKPLSD